MGWAVPCDSEEAAAASLPRSIDLCVTVNTGGTWTICEWNNPGCHVVSDHLHLCQLGKQFPKSWKQFILISEVRILERVEGDLGRLVNKH